MRVKGMAIRLPADDSAEKYLNIDVGKGCQQKLPATDVRPREAATETS